MGEEVRRNAVVVQRRFPEHQVPLRWKDTGRGQHRHETLCLVINIQKTNGVSFSFCFSFVWMHCTRSWVVTVRSAKNGFGGKGSREQQPKPTWLMRIKNNTPDKLSMLLLCHQISPATIATTCKAPYSRNTTIKHYKLHRCSESESNQRYCDYYTMTMHNYTPCGKSCTQ